MIQTIDFAPLDGITKIVFRQVWSQFFGGVDRYFLQRAKADGKEILEVEQYTDVYRALGSYVPSSGYQCADDQQIIRLIPTR